MRLLGTRWAVFIFFAIAAMVLSPPDILTQMTLMAGMFIIFGLVFFGVSRVRSFNQTPDSMKRVILVLTCVLSVTTVASVLFADTSRRQSIELYKYRDAASQDPNGDGGREILDPGTVPDGLADER